MESWTVLQEISLGTWVTAGGVWIAAIAASIAAILLGRLVALLEGGRRVSGDTRRWHHDTRAIQVIVAHHASALDGRSANLGTPLSAICRLHRSPAVVRAGPVAEAEALRRDEAPALSLFELALGRERELREASS